MNDEYYFTLDWDGIYRYIDEIHRCVNKLKTEQVREQTINLIREQKEAPTMQVTYKGFTGELVKLERKEAVITSDPFVCRWTAKIYVYDLSIYDSEKQVTHSFTGVKLEDVNFIGGAVTFGG